MKIPEIDFSRVRSHGGSRDGGFEELCSQLAALEERPAASTYIRTGRGADAGVECYIVNSDGTERGWQAKYVFSWDDGLGGQLDKSIKSTLDKHPELTEYIVCLPYNLPDARQKNRKSQREKWNSWKSKWEATAKKAGRNITINLWDETALAMRLAADKPQISGRLYYWFSDTELTPEWFVNVFNRAKSDLGSRYTPESNIDLPIRVAFAGCTRSNKPNRTMQEWATKISDEVSRVNFALRELSDKEKNSPQILTFRKVVADLNERLASGPFDLTEKFPLEDCKASVSQAQSAAQELLFWVYAKYEKEKDSSQDIDYARATLGTLTDQLARILDALDGDDWQLANANAVLLYGGAGSGKSHLLADVVEHQVHLGCPAILTLGSYMTDGDPWQQILRTLDLPLALKATDFLGALDAAAEAADSRVLLCIDAINERNGPSVWPDRIGSFLKLAEQFGRVVIVVSCRTTYLPRMVPEQVIRDQLTKIQHRGFADEGGRAAALYLTKRGIVRAGAPNLVPEMHIPLFLKTLCDALESNGQSEIPRGLRGVSALFEFYYSAVIEAVTSKLALDPRLEQVQSAIKSLANLFAEQGEGYASYEDVNKIFETIVPSQGLLERGLLPQLESEGLLSVENFADEEGDMRTDVRFTFERYSDHTIARHLLDVHLHTSNPSESFKKGTVLGDIAFGDDCHRKAGVIEAMAIQLPEVCGKEIIDLGRVNNWVVLDAFDSSFLWRNQSNFTSRTMELARQHFGCDEYLSLLVTISTEPQNQFNADYLNEKLRHLPMPERDAIWSVWLMHQSGLDGPVMILVDWALRNGQEHIREERAELTAITLTWFLSCSNREIRDKATKALASLLAGRLALAEKILAKFAKVNDLYVLERLLAGIYGAVLQGKDQDDLGNLASAVFDFVFASGNPPLNELLRDHARCILDYAAYQQSLSINITSEDYTPPYKSPWPIEHVSDELIESYRQDYNGSYLQDDIVSSCVSDGDFARYVIDPFVGHFGPKESDEPEPQTYAELADEWSEEFIFAASEAQMNALVRVYSAAEKLEGKPNYGDSPDHKALKAANEALREALTNDEWGEYRARAKMHIEHGMFTKNTQTRRNAARFDSGWARRWVCKRAHDLGWTSERFAALEPRSGYDRHDHQIERIGKKYQWLAFHELAARMSDNVQFFGANYGDEVTPYCGVIQLRLRDMDPSLLATETFYDSWKEWPRSWWVPVEPKLLPASPIERLSWLRSDQDILNGLTLIALSDPKTGKDWLPLELHAGWRQSGFENEQSGMLRETWFRTNCYLVRRSDEKELLDSLQGRVLTGQHDLPNFEFDTEYHLGEYPWHSDVRKRDRWSETESWHKLPVPIRPIAFDMLREKSGGDYSVDKTINLMMPTPWLIEAMRLKLIGGQNPEFVDKGGDTVIFDPSVNQPGHEGAFVEKNAFCNMLDEKRLSAIWIIAGEKSVYGSPAASSGYGGRVDHTGVYRIENGEVVQCHYKTETIPPAKEQLLELLKLDKLPPSLNDWIK